MQPGTEAPDVLVSVQYGRRPLPKASILSPAMELHCGAGHPTLHTSDVSPREDFLKHWSSLQTRIHTLYVL